LLIKTSLFNKINDFMSSILSNTSLIEEATKCLIEEATKCLFRT